MGIVLAVTIDGNCLNASDGSARRTQPVQLAIALPLEMKPWLAGCILAPFWGGWSRAKQFQRRWGLGLTSLRLSAQLKDFKRKIRVSDPVAIGYRKAVVMWPKA